MGGTRLVSNRGFCRNLADDFVVDLSESDKPSVEDFDPILGNPEELSEDEMPIIREEKVELDQKELQLKPYVNNPNFLSTIYDVEEDRTLCNTDSNQSEICEEEYSQNGEMEKEESLGYNDLLDISDIQSQRSLKHKINNKGAINSQNFFNGKKQITNSQHKLSNKNPFSNLHNN